MREFILHKGPEKYIFRWAEGCEMGIYWAGCEKFTSGEFDRLDLLLLARALGFLPEGDILSFFTNGGLPIC